MLSETTAVRNAWAASERELQLRITINGQVFNAEDVTDFSYDSGAMNGESLTLGSTYANSIKITFSHIVEKLELQDKITPEIGIKLPDDTWNYTKLGVFIIDSEVKQDRNNGQTSLSATDNMIMLSGNYVPKIAYPAGVIEAITDISNQAGVKLNEANIARMTDTTIGALGKEATYRQAVGYVAQIAGGFAQFDRDGLLNIRELEDPNFRITSDCYMSKGLTKNETFYRIGGMQAEVTTTQTDNDGNENQETVTLQSGSPSGSQIKLTNPAMSQQLLDQLYDQYADINFYPYSLEWFADPNLEAGDWVTIVDNKGNEFKAPALGLTLSFNGGLSGTLKADTTVTSQATFVYSGQFNQVVTRLHNDFATIAGNHIYKGIDQPIFAKKGDLWYQSVGPDTVMQVYQFDPDTGLYSWVEVGSTKPSRELSDQMDQVKKDITDQSTKIDGAVANANTAVSNSDLATKTASAAKQSVAEAVTVANQANLISSQAQASALSAKADAAAALNDATTAKADANTAKANATQAINDAAAAKGQATNALGQANTAIGNATDALNKVNNMSVGGRNYIENSNFDTGLSGWDNVSNTTFEIKTINGLNYLHMAYTGTDKLYAGTARMVNLSMKKGEQFTISWKAFSDKMSGTGLTIGFHERSSAGTILAQIWPRSTIFNLASTPQSFSYTVTADVDFDSLWFMEYGPSNNAYDLYITELKLEKGNQATDWTPAPEDQATVDWTKSQLDITDKKITAGITTVTNTLNNNIASATANMATTTWTNTQIDAAKTAINLSVEQSITTSENTLNNNIANATKDMATQTWTKGQLSVTNDNVSASVQKLHDTVSGEITTATTDMATKSWTQGKLDLTDSQITAQISDVKDGLTTKFTTLQQTLSGVQVTANNAVTQGQLTLLSDQFTSTISGISVGGTNLIPNSSTPQVLKRPEDNPNYPAWFGRPIYKGLKNNETYTFSAVAKAETTDKSAEQWGIRIFQDSGDHQAVAKTLAANTGKRQSLTFTTPDDGIAYDVWIYAGAMAQDYTPKDLKVVVTVSDYKLETGTMATDWSPAPEDQATVSQFTQLQDDINLSVKTGDLISQINVESGETLIESASGKGVLNLSAATVNFSGEAFIPAASIKDLSADYIKTGTLDASKVNLISVNAASITAGIITGDNLSINLDSGEILFQKGSIKSVPGRWNNVLDIEIEDGTFSQADYRGNGVRFQDGSIYMTRDVLNWNSANTGVKGKVDYGTVRYSSSFLNDVPGMMIYGSEGIVVGTSNYTTISPFMPIWSISGSGMSAGQQGLALGSSEKVVIASGQKYDVYAGTSKPTIMVGTTNSYTAPGDWTAGGSDDPAGNGISLLAKSIVLNAEDLVGGNEVGNVKMGGLALACDGRSGYVLSATTYKRTYSGSANMIITENGVYGRVTSARKYKLLDHDAETVIDHAKRILDINPKQWFDKAEVETISQSLTNSTESQLMTDYKFQQYYGFIADDFHDAGLDEVVQFKNGEVDSLAYDRIPMYHNVILKDHETRIEKLERENKELKQQLAAIS